MDMFFVEFMFDPPSPSVSISPSPELMTMMDRMKIYFALVSEADRRSLIDIVLLDAMWAADALLNQKRKVYLLSNFSDGARCLLTMRNSPAL
jgi:hypothetical protein